MSKKKKGKDIATDLANFLLDGAETRQKQATTRLLGADKPRVSEQKEKTIAVVADDEDVERTTRVDLTENKLKSKKKKKVSHEEDADKTIQISTKKTSHEEPSPFNDTMTVQTNSEARPVDQVVRKEVVSGDVVFSADASLAQSETLRLAQDRILELESVIESLREDNEQLMAAGETLADRVQALTARSDQLEAKHKEESEIFEDEKQVFKASAESKNRDIDALRMKVEELQNRLKDNLRKVRVRERELENRLELVKVEGKALIKSKDELILDLKRQLDQLTYEIDGHRGKGRDLNKKVDEMQERIRRSVKALRLALSMLEGETEEVVPLRKAEGE